MLSQVRRDTVEEKAEQQGAEGVPLAHTPVHREGSTSLTPHTQGSAGPPVHLCQPPHNILRDPKLIPQHLPELLPTHPVIGLLQVNEGYCQGATSCRCQLEEVCNQELVILSAMAGSEPCLLPCTPAGRLCQRVQASQQTKREQLGHRVKYGDATVHGRISRAAPPLPDRH